MTHAPDPSSRPLPTFAFGPFALDCALLELRRGTEPVPLGPKAFAFLQYLVTHRDRVVPRAELFEKLWPGIRVGDAALRSVVHEVRNALAEGEGSASRIATLHGRGYRFVDEVREQTPAPRASDPPTPASDFLDRDQERALLREALRAAQAGERRVVLLHGPPGIGKTRTALELGREAAQAGFDVHVARGQDAGGAPPYWHWIQLLRSFAERYDADALEAAAPAQSLLSTLYDWSEPDASAALPNVRDAEAARFRWLDAVTRFLRHAAELRPQLVVLDDLHWADDASIQILTFVAQQLPRAQLLVIGTHRELASSHPLGQVLRESGTQSLRLAGLDRRTVEVLLERALGRPAAPALLERVYVASGGNPLFVAELIRQLGAHGTPAGPLPVPRRLRDAIWTRLSECSEGCRRVLRVASVAGASCSLWLLRRVIGGSHAELLEALGEAEQRNLLVDVDGAYAFSHGVIREVIYEELAPIDRMRLHESVGESLERQCGRDPSRKLAELAHHFGQALASQPDRALHYARRAAQSAAASFAYREAMALYRDALRALGHLEPDDTAQRCALLVELGEVAQFAGEPRECFIEAFREAMTLARAARLDAWLGRAAERCVVHLSARGELVPYAQHRGNPLVEELATALAEAQPACTPEVDPQLCVRLHVALAILHYALHELARSRAAFEVALRVADASGDASLQAEVILPQLDLGLLFDAGAERAAYADRLLSLARECARPDVEAHACMAQLQLAVERGDRDGAERAGQALELLERQRPLGAFSPAQSWSVLRAQLDGRLDEAQIAMAQAVKSASRSHADHEWTTAAASALIWWICILRGNAHVFTACLESYVATRRVAPVLPVFDVLLARSHAELGRSEEACRRLDDFGKKLADLPRSPLALVCACLAAEVCALCGRPEHAALLFSFLEPYAARVAMVGEFLCLGSVQRMLGALAALLGRWDESELCFARALAHARGLRAPILSALVQLEHARALGRHPDSAQRARAPALLDSTALAARQLGLPGVEQQAQRLAEPTADRHSTKARRVGDAVPAPAQLSRN